MSKGSPGIVVVVGPVVVVVVVEVELVEVSVVEVVEGSAKVLVVEAEVVVGSSPLVSVVPPLPLSPQATNNTMRRAIVRCRNFISALLS
jgi:hypothetical protein